MSTTVEIGEEAHIAILKKQLEFREKKLKAPTVTELVNKLVIDGIKEVEAE